MSSYSDIKKKVKKNTDTSSVKKSGYSASGSYAEIKSKVKANGTSYDIDDDFISTFNNDATSFLKDAGKSYSDYSYSASKSGNNYKSYLDRWSSINSRAKYIRAYMNSTRDTSDEDSYNETMSFLDDFDNYSRQYLNGFRSYDNYYSNFKTEDDYDKYRFGWLSGTSDDYMKDDMVTGRQGIYNKNKQRLDEINALLPNTSNRVSSGALTMRDGYTIPTSTLSKEERDALEKEKSALEAENRKYEQFQKVKDDTYADTKNPDYEKYSQQRNYGNPTKEELDREDIAGEDLSVSLDGKGILYDDGEYYTLNDGTKVRKPQELDIPDKLGAYLSASKDDVTEAYNRLAGSNGNYIRTWDNLIQEGETSYWNELTEGEVDYYYYVYGTQGQEAAYNYLDNMAVILGQRHEDSVKEEVSNANAYEKILYNIASIAASPIAGAASFVDDAKNIITGNEINPYSASHRLQNFSSIVRSDTAEIINEATNNAAIPGLGFTAGDAYQSVMSGLDSLVGGATVGKAYSFIMGAGSASSEARKLYESGASSKQIALGSLASGVAETLFEYVSLDHFLGMKSPKTKAEWVKQVLAQGGVEASEEIATEVSNLITNAIIMGNQSDWANMTIGDAIIDVLNAGLGGFISGAGMAGVGSGARYANYNRQMTQYGKGLSKSGAMDAYVDYAESNSIGKDGKKLLGQVNKIKSNNAVDSFSSSDNSETGRFTRYEYNKMGKLADQIDSKTMETATKAEIKARLEAQGANASNKMVNAIYKQITSDADITLARGEVKNLAEKITSDNTFDSAVSMRALTSHISMYSNKAKETEAKTIEDSVKDKVSDTNETIIESTGEAVEIKKVASIENGKMILELSDGRTVSSNDVLYSSKYQALAYETVLDLGCSADTANAIIDSVKANDATSASKYLLGVKEAYRYGLYGLDPKTVNTKVFSNELTENQMNFAYELGRNDASTKASLAQESVNAKKGTGNKEGKILYSSSVESLTNRQKVAYDAIGKVVADITHNNVVFYESVLKDGKRVFSKDVAGHKAGESAPNGFYVKGNGTIYVDINAGNNGEGVILYTVAHELTHFIHEWSPDKFKVLADFLVEEYGKQGTDVNQLIQNQIAKAKENGRALSYDDAFEEVVADSMEPMFTDTNLSEKLAKLKEKDQTLWEKIKEFFSDLLAKIKEAYDGLSPQSDEGKLVKQMVDSIEKISDLFADALVDAGETFSAVEDSTLGEVDIDGDASTHEMSLRSTVEGAGLYFSYNEKTGEYRILDKKNGKSVTSVTTDQIKSSPLGNIVNLAVQNGNITSDEAEKQYGFLTELVNMCLENKENFTMVWEIAGTQVFSAIKANSDTQYGKTIDFSTVCKKTQQIIDVISGTQKKLKRGLTKEEVKNIVYNETGKAGEPTPCPVCYVFSRWMGIGGILQQMYDFQSKYANSSEDEIRDFINSVEDDIVKHANTPNRKGKLKADYFDKNGKIKFGKVIADLKRNEDGKIRSANKAIARNADNLLAIQQNEALLENASEKDAKNIQKKIDKLRKKIVNTEKLNQMVKDAEDSLRRYEEYQYLTKTYMDEVKAEDGSHIGWKLDKNFKPVDPDILFDLNNGAEFATKYPKSWKYRTTKGCNAGKAILPYSDARVGETIQGVAYSDVKDILVGDNNAFLNGDVEKQNDYVKRAIKKQLAQNLIGGMRYQSTSDFRFEYGSDYLITFLEMQAIGAKVQLYTKVIEAVDFLCTVGADVNMSVMPLNDGYITLPDGRKQLVFSSVTGINSEAAIAKSKQYDNAQLILVGINDEHIRLALNGDDVNGDIVTFVIPFHGSGNTVNVIQELMDQLGEDLDVTKARDYSAVQTDHFKKNRTKEQKDLWDLRVKIISRTGTVNGKSSVWDGTLSPNEYNLLNSEAGSKFLKDLYNRFYVDENADEYGVALSKAQAEQIFPYEYWDKSVTYDNAFLNGERFKDYCESMGIIPRFSGLDSDGKRVGYGDFTNEPGYWKLLIDRKMYNNDGTFHVQQKINVTNFKSETLSPEWASANYGDVMQKDSNPKKTNAIVENVIAQLEKQSVAKSNRDVYGTIGMSLSPSAQTSENQGETKYSERILMGSLFSGGGTLEAGLVYQMVDKQFAVESNKKIASVYTDNNGKEHMFVGDVRDFESGGKKNVFYLHASPVCKNFSAAKKNGGETTLDIVTAKATARLLEEQMPQVFTVENVKQYKGSEAYGIIVKKIIELGYKWDVDVYNSSDYGAATSRERLIIRAVKDVELPAKPRKTGFTPWYDTVSDLIDGLPESPMPKWMQDRYNAGNYRKDFPLFILGGNKGYKLSTAYANEPAPTILANSHDARIVMPDGRVLRATPRVLARIQGLPDSYNLPKQTTLAYTVVGNGIPTQLTKAVMGGLLDSAYEQTHEGNQLYSERNTDSIDSRTLLANALETTAQNDLEKKYISQYKEKISSINNEQAKLAELRSQIKELSFAKGKRDKDKIRELKDEATKTANRITVYDKQLLRLESTKPLKEVLTREKEIAVKKAEQAGKEALDAYKEIALQKQMDITNRYKERTERAKDRKKETEVRNKIKKIASDLNNRLLNPTESKYVPKALVEGVIRVCNEIDPTGANQDTMVAQKYRSGLDALRDLKAQYDKLQSMDYEFSSEFNKDFSDSIEELANAVGGKPLRDMSRAQLEDVYTIVSDINAMVKNATKQIGIDERITNYEAGQEVISLMKKVKASGLTTGQLMSKMREWMDNPMRAVREMSAYDPDSRLTKLFDALNEGRRKADKFIMDNSKKFEVLRDTKEGKQAYIDAVEKPVDFGFGFKISKMQAMQAILTYEREQANENRKHLNTPVMFTDVELDVKGKYSDAFDNGHEIMVDESFVNAVMNKLSDWDKQYLEAARRFFEVESKNAVNEVSMITKHRLVATERSYIPYKVNQDYIQKQSENLKFDSTIEGSGVLKSVKSNASQQLVMRGLNTVIDEHMNTVSKIYGLSIPIRNWNKVFNIIQTKEDGGLSVKKAIRDAWGTNGVKLLDQAVADLQSPRRGDRVKLLDDIKSAFVTSTLAGNISVWMKQAASYPTAGAILSLGSLGKGLAYLPIIRKMTGIQLQELYDEIDAHTSQHWIRRQGLSTQELGDINQSKGWENKLNKRFGKASPMNWIQSMDVWTTASLWVACKAEVDKRGIGSGSEQYWEEVARLYDQVIEETQPMYDPLHRAEVTKNKMLGMFVMFQTQPLQNSGILREATMQYKMDKKTYGSGSEQVKEAGLKFRKAVASQLASHLVFTAMTLVAAAILHKMNPWRDDDDELTKESVLTEFSKEFGKNVFGAVVPVFGSYAVTFAEKLIGGSRYDVLSNPTIDKINDSLTMLANAKTDILKYVEYLKDPRGDKVDPPFETLIDVSSDVASYLGIPAKNLVNIINAIRLHAEDYSNGAFLSFEAGVNRTASQDSGRLYEAIMSGDTAEVNKLKTKYAEKYTTELRKALKENDPRIREAAEARYSGDLPKYEKIARAIKAENKFSQDDIVAAINSIINELSKDDLKDEADKEQKHKGLYSSSDIEYALENGKDSYMPAIMEDFIQTNMDNGKDQEEAEEATTQAIRNVIRTSYRDGDMDYAEALNALVSYTDMSDDEAESRVNYWDFQIENPDIDLKEATVNKYQELIAPEGISVNVFYEFYKQASKAEGEDLDGDGKNDQYTKMDKIIAIIDSMSISSYEKDVLLQFYYDSPKSAAYKRKSW